MWIAVWKPLRGMVCRGWIGESSLTVADQHLQRLALPKDRFCTCRLRWRILPVCACQGWIEKVLDSSPSRCPKSVHQRVTNEAPIDGNLLNACREKQRSKKLLEIQGLLALDCHNGSLFQQKRSRPLPHVFHQSQPS